MTEPVPVLAGALIVGVPAAACLYSGVMAWHHEIKARAGERDRMIATIVQMKTENRQLRIALREAVSKLTTEHTEGNQQP